MAKYRKRPAVVDATQWFGDGDHDHVDQYPALRRVESCAHCSGPIRKHGWVDTLEGGHIVCPGDWIITGVKGDSYPCKPDVFEQTYELAEDCNG